jgi:maleylacetate reductase
VASPSSGKFVYANPPRVHWGAGTLVEALEEELRLHNASRVFVITTRSVAAHSQLGHRLAAVLGPRCVGEFSGISQHAPAAAVAAAVSAAAEARPDVLVSIGGGSPIDAAKAVAFGLATGLDLTDARAAELARQYQPTPSEVLPQVAIPTTLSAAELSGLAGFTTEDQHEKVGLRGEALIPAAVVYDAELTQHTPLDLWLSTGIRAIDHAVETLVAPGDHPLPDVLALDALRRLRVALLASRRDPADLEARTESQLGAWFSFALPGRAAAGLSHTLGKRIGSRHAIPHGVTSCLVLPHVMRYLAPRRPAPLARVAEALGVDTRAMDATDAACAAAAAVAELVRRLGLPQHLAAYGLTDEDLYAAARPVAGDQYPLEDIVDIYRASL